jgi:hypothetical protein
MQHHRTPDKASSTERLEGIILGLLVDRDQQRPWSVNEIARATGSQIHALTGIERLCRHGLIHRWESFVSATNAAVHFHDLMHSYDRDSRHEWDIEHQILEVLLTASGDSTKWLTDKEVRKALRATRRYHKLTITDALNRLDGAGLVDRRKFLVTPSDPAVHFNQIMTL